MDKQVDYWMDTQTDKQKDKGGIRNIITDQFLEVVS